MINKKALAGIFGSLFCVLVGCQSVVTSNTGDDLEIRSYGNIKQKDERSANLNSQLGLGYLAQGNVQRAKSKLLLALKQAPEYSPALSAMGFYLEKTGEPKQAEGYYRRALNFAAQEGSSQNNYGTFLCRQGRYQESIQHFMLAVKDPNYLANAEAYENAGLCSLMVPDNKMAVMYFKKALAEDPQRATSLLELVNLSYKQGNYQVANSYLQQHMAIVKANKELLHLGILVAKQAGSQADVANYKRLMKGQYARTEAQSLL